MLEARGLTKRYSDVTALDGLALTARPGRLLGFLGPNGAGKTTTIRAIFGLVRPDAGSITWQGRTITAQHLAVWGYLPEQRGLYPRMGVARQLRFLARLHGLDRTEAADAADRWLDTLGLSDRADENLTQLSHGNQQRVQFAAALIHQPELLVLDEPFNGLDPTGIEAFGTILRERARAGATIIVSSHQLDLVEGLCDDVVIIAAGRERLAGTLDEVRRAAGWQTVRLRLAGGAPVGPLPGATPVATNDGITTLRVALDVDARALLDQVGGTIEVFSLEPPRLSELFHDTIAAGPLASDLDGGPDL